MGVCLVFCCSAAVVFVDPFKMQHEYPIVGMGGVFTDLQISGCCHFPSFSFFHVIYILVNVH